MVTLSGRLSGHGSGHGSGRKVGTVVVTLVGASLVSPSPSPERVQIAAWPSVMRLSRIVNVKPYTTMSQGGVQKRMAPQWRRTRSQH